MKFLFALLLSVVVSDAAPLLSPKAATEQAGSGARMRLVVVKSTNRVSRISFAWDSQIVPDSFNLKIGSAPSRYTNSIPTGRTNGFTFAVTNWNERSVRHWFAVTARIGTNESAVSNEVFSPPYPDNTLLVQWQTNWPVVTVLTSTNLLIPLAQWQTAGQVTDGRCFTTNLLDGARFFAIDRPDVLTVRTFNPMNLAQGQTLCQTNYVAPASASPVLTWNLDSNNAILNWTFSADDSNGWIVQKSSDGQATWTTFGTTASGVDTFDVNGSGANFWRVVRNDGAGNPVGPFSNSIFINSQPS